MINYDKHIYELETLGYTIVENVFSPTVVNDLKEHLKIALEEDEKMFSSQAAKNPDLIVDMSIHHPVFLQSLDNDKMMEIFSRILGSNCILYSYTSTILKPKKKSGVHNMHIDTNKFIPNYITGVVMTMPLDDFTNENGATLYLPGSHNSSTVPSEETFSKYSQSTARKAGDALFFNPRVFHRAADNNTDKIRYGLTIYATRNFFKPRFNFQRMIPKETLPLLSERVTNFLGFNARIPESMEEFYLPADKRIYKVQ
jgi:ectoine hydroxylase-related dioxygenase (phytanoyl-CoA dioxygenase family)